MVVAFARQYAAHEDLARRMPDSTKARTVLGWSCGTALADGVGQDDRVCSGEPVVARPPGTAAPFRYRRYSPQ